MIFDEKKKFFDFRMSLFRRNNTNKRHLLIYSFFFFQLINRKKIVDIFLKINSICFIFGNSSLKSDSVTEISKEKKSFAERKQYFSIGKYTKEIKFHSIRKFLSSIRFWSYSIRISFTYRSFTLINLTIN